MCESETMGERGQILTISTRISGICKEKAVKYGPLYQCCNRIILGPTGSWTAILVCLSNQAFARLKFECQPLCLSDALGRHALLKKREVLKTGLVPLGGRKVEP